MNLIQESEFLGHNPDSSIRLITLRNENGFIAQCTNYGARWVSMWMPDRKGTRENVLLGFDTLSGYRKAGEQYHGAMVGRVCGRIGNARFSLAGKEYKLSSNDVYGKPVKNHLHGGIYAFHNRIWTIKEIGKSGEPFVTFSLFSPDGEEGYPGNLKVEVTYTLTAGNAVQIACKAWTDRPTLANITNHAFFNLQGNTDHKSILTHQLTLRASAIVACDSELLPTGETSLVDGQFYDFRIPRTLGDSLLSAEKQTQNDNGFSIAFVLDQQDSLRAPAACLSCHSSGRRLELFTNQPSLQVYTGYFMAGSDIGHGGSVYDANAGIALEPQGYPDAINHPTFIPIVIDKGEVYNHLSEYRFFCDEY